MDMLAEQTLIQKIKILAPEHLNEASDFIDFLINKSNKNNALKRVLVFADQADSQGLTALNESQLMQEVKLVRQQRKLH